MCRNTSQIFSISRFQDGVSKLIRLDFFPSNAFLRRRRKKALLRVIAPNMSAPPRRCWVGNAASSVCAVGQRTHPAEVQSEPHLPSDVVLGQLVTERIGLENGIVLSFSS